MKKSNTIFWIILVLLLALATTAAGFGPQSPRHPSDDHQQGYDQQSDDSHHPKHHPKTCLEDQWNRQNLHKRNQPWKQEKWVNPNTVAPCPFWQTPKEFNRACKKNTPEWQWEKYCTCKKLY